MSIVFDRAVAYYDQTRALPGDWHQQIIDALVASTSIVHESNVLEIGIGTGRIALSVIEHVRRLFGIDLSLEMMGVLRTKAAEKQAAVDIAQANALYLPFPDNSFDVVYAVHVYHLVQHWQDALLDARRVLKPGGRFAVNYHRRDPGSPNAVLRKQMHVFAREYGLDTRRPGAQSEEEVREAISGWDNGLQVVPVMEWSEQEIPEKILEELDRQIFSETWSIPRDIMDRIMPRLREWARESFGDLTKPLTVRGEARWLVAKKK